jgi:hypothetical protein
MRAGVPIASTKVAEIPTRWQHDGWETKLIKACKGTRLQGPLKKRYARRRFLRGDADWRKHVGAGRSAVLVHIPGNGVSYCFVVVVESAGVREIWKHVEFDAG